MKRFLSVLLSLTITLSVLPVRSFAAGNKYVSFCGNGKIPADITEITIGTRNSYASEQKTERAASVSETVYNNLSRKPLDIKELYRKLPDLKRISIAENELKNAEYFTKFKKLTVLELYECEGVSDLDFAPQCKRLTEFAYTCEGLSDISQIGKMTRLKKLTVADATTYGYLSGDYADQVQEGNYLRDITPLENLTDLTELTVEGAAVKDISPLLNMPRLTKLTLSTAVKTDLSPLEKLKKLKSFTFSVSGERFISAINIPALKNLTELSLKGGAYYDDSLSELTELKNLEFESCGIENRDEKYLYKGKRLPKLETLILTDADLADKTFTLFSTAKKLEMDDCRINNLTKSRVFEEHRYNGEREYDDQNYSLNYLKNFKELESLTVNDCFIFDIKGLKKLKYLNLAYNRIMDITPLEKLENLKILNLSGADCYNGYGRDFLNPLKNFKNLEELDVSFIFDEYADIDMWKEGTENSVFDTVSALPKLKKLTVSAIHCQPWLSEDIEAERRKLFEEKMPYCELIVYHQVVFYD